MADQGGGVSGPHPGVQSSHVFVPERVGIWIWALADMACVFLISAATWTSVVCPLFPVFHHLAGGTMTGGKLCMPSFEARGFFLASLPCCFPVDVIKLFLGPAVLLCPIIPEVFAIGLGIHKVLVEVREFVAGQ